MKFRAHETFYIRKGWLSKGIKNVVRNPAVFLNKDENPMDVLGIGANMVKSLRFWLQAVGLTEETKSTRRQQSLTDVGKLIYENDPYIEEMGSLWLLQFCLGNNKELATSWYFFFNCFNLSEFVKEDFIEALHKYILLQGETVSTRSLDDDFNCIINTYIPRYKINPKKVLPEDNMDCPFGELGLLDYQNKKSKVYRKISPLADSIPPLILLACILLNDEKRKEVPITDLQNKKGLVGKIFNLNIITLMDILSKAELQGYIKIIRTAGLDVIRINENLTAQGCIEMYYQRLLN